MLGQPIEHSLSPALHRAAYASLGLSNWSYERFEVGRGGLAEFVGHCDETWRGLSLTMPLKDEALKLGRLSPTAELTGAANTLVFTAGGIDLYNTDVEGFWRPLVAHFEVAEPGSVPIESAVILGGGATARSAFLALATMGVRRITVSARSAAKVAGWEPMFAATGITPEVVAYGEVGQSDLLISTIPAKAADELAVRIAEVAPVLFDVVYDPWPTALARAGSARDHVVFSGLDMLVGQAVGQIQLMTGRTVPADVLMSAGREAQRQRAVL